MIKRILLPLDFSQYTDAALQYACYIAKRQDATVTGMVVLQIPGIAKIVGPITSERTNWSERLDQRVTEKVNERITTLLDKFKQTCQKEGVKHVEAEFQGTCPEQIMFQSMFYDMVITGFQTSYYFDESKHIEVPLEKLLSRSITPFLVVPQNFAPGKKVLLAFDGSLPAARSMQRFSHLANAKDSEVTIVISHHDQGTAFYYLDKAEEYLKAHGLLNIKKEWTTKNIISAIKEQYLDQVDMFITGMHSKDTLKSFFLGSLTRFLLGEAKKPLFLAQ